MRPPPLLGHTRRGGRSRARERAGGVTPGARGAVLGLGVATVAGASRPRRAATRAARAAGRRQRPDMAVAPRGATCCGSSLLLAAIHPGPGAPTRTQCTSAPLSHRPHPRAADLCHASVVGADMELVDSADSGATVVNVDAVDGEHHGFGCKQGPFAQKHSSALGETPSANLALPSSKHEVAEGRASNSGLRGITERRRTCAGRCRHPQWGGRRADCRRHDRDSRVWRRSTGEPGWGGANATNMGGRGNGGRWKVPLVSACTYNCGHRQQRGGDAYRWRQRIFIVAPVTVGAGVAAAVAVAVVMAEMLAAAVAMANEPPPDAPYEGGSAERRSQQAWQPRA